MAPSMKLDSKRGPSQLQATGLQVVEPPTKAARRKRATARRIAPKVRQLIVDEYRVVQDSRELAQKHELPIHVLFDVLLLGLHRPVQSERLTVADVWGRKQA